MRNLKLPLMIILSGILFIGCGGTAEKEKTETKTPAVVNGTNNQAANANAQQTRNDADDLPKASQPSSNSANQATNQKRTDADDIRGNSRSNSKIVSNRRDSDDQSKPHNDRDDDDH